MKWILLTLLVLNLLFGGYEYWQSHQPSQNIAPAAVEAQFNNLAPTSRQLQRLALVNERTPVVQTVQNQCIKIQGLSSGDGLEVVESRLKALEVNVGRAQETVVLRQDFQVVVGPYANAELARNELQTLAAKGIDSYVISSGSNRNSLSLGVFSSSLNAERKQQEVKNRGFDAKIVVKDHQGKASVLFVDSKSSGLVNDATLSSVLAPFKKAKFSRYRCD